MIRLLRLLGLLGVFLALLPGLAAAQPPPPPDAPVDDHLHGGDWPICLVGLPRAPPDGPRPRGRDRPSRRAPRARDFPPLVAGLDERTRHRSSPDRVCAQGWPLALQHRPVHGAE